MLDYWIKYYDVMVTWQNLKKSLNCEFYFHCLACRTPPYLHRAVLEQLLDVFGHARSSHAFRVWAANVTVSQSEEEWKQLPGGFKSHKTQEKDGNGTVWPTFRSPEHSLALPASFPQPPSPPTAPEHTPCGPRTWCSPLALLGAVNRSRHILGQHVLEHVVTLEKVENFIKMYLEW